VTLPLKLYIIFIHVTPSDTHNTHDSPRLVHDNDEFVTHSSCMWNTLAVTLFPPTHTWNDSLPPIMGWLRLVGSIKLPVSFAEYCLFYRALLQKRPVIVSILLTKSTRYQCVYVVTHVNSTDALIYEWFMTKSSSWHTHHVCDTHMKWLSTLPTRLRHDSHEWYARTHMWHCSHNF